MRLASNLLLISLVVLLNACSSTKPRIVNFEKTNFSEVPNWENDNHRKALKVFINSCTKINKKPLDKPISNLTAVGGQVKDWQAPCAEAIAMVDYNDLEAKEFFEKWFVPYRVQNEEMNPTGLLTGYYEIELEGSPHKTSRFKYPVYRMPLDMDYLKGTADFQHAAINDGLLNGKGLEVAWVDDPARLYFMQIQGSGKIKMYNGNILRLGFDGHNGYRFQGISGKLKDHGQNFGSAVDIMDWLKKRPDKGRDVIESDPSYVFFRPVEAPSAIGGQGVPLHPERSIAIDSGLYPYGMPVWVEAKVPKTSAYQASEYSRLFVAQDTGGAIRGAVRGDIFFGAGKNAEIVAGGFKVKGKFYVLFPKTVSVPSTYKSR